MVKIGKARATTYVAVKPINNDYKSLPLFEVKGRSSAIKIAEFHLLYKGKTLLKAAHILPGLPPQLDNFPQDSFLAALHAPQSDTCWPGNYSDWNIEDKIQALICDGQLLPGNLILGEQALEKYLANYEHPLQINESLRHAAYPKVLNTLAQGSYRGEIIHGSEPKFCAVVTGKEHKTRHVIVKFSEPMQDIRGKRMADLLMAEHLALEFLARQGLKTVRSKVIKAANRVFLEIERYDRINEYTRQGAIELPELKNHQNLSEETLNKIELVELFTQLIGDIRWNQTEVAIFQQGLSNQEIVPFYDIAPSLYRPESTGYISKESIVIKPPTARNTSFWFNAMDLAQGYWQEIVKYPYLSSDFRSLAKKNMLEIKRVKVKYGP